MNRTNRKLAYRRSASFGGWLAFSLIGALLLQGWIFSTILDNTVGPIRNLWRPFRNTQELRVALLKSGTSALMSEPNPEDYYDAVRQWEVALDEAGIPYRVIGDQDLTPELASSSTVLVLPSAVCISDAQRATIQALPKQGMGLVVSGALGARDATCVWRGWDFLTSVTGVRKPDTVQVRQSAFASFRGGQFFSELVPAGYRLALPPQELVFGTVHSPDVYRSDGRLRPAQGDSVDDVAVALHGQYQAGRVVWMGFRETLPGGSTKAQRGTLNQYLVSSVLWVGRQPLVSFGNWPNRSRAGVLLAETIDNPESARPADNVLRQEKVSATYLMTSSQARVSPAALRRLRENGEIASGGDTTDAFVDQDASSQTARLVKARMEFAGLGSPRIAGFDPPQQVWDAATVDALRSAGYSYYFDRSAFERAVPQLMFSSPAPKSFLPVNEAELARISTMGATDMEVIARYRGPEPWGVDLADGFVRDFRMTEYVGGLYTLSFRGDLLGAAENTHILRSVVRTMKADRAWIASGEQLTAWWSQREKIKVESRLITPTRIRLAITNRTNRPMQNATVYVYLPRRPKTVRLIPVMLDRMTPYSELVNDKNDILRLDFATLKPELSYVGIIVLDEK